MKSELDYWLEKLRHGHWRLHGHPDLRRPTQWLAADYQWPQGFADVVIIRAQDQVVAFRTPIDEHTDLLNPKVVTWVYGDNSEESAVWVLRAVLALPQPSSPGEPVQVMPAPPACRIPLIGRRPVTIRQLSTDPA